MLTRVDQALARLLHVALGGNGVLQVRDTLVRRDSDAELELGRTLDGTGVVSAMSLRKVADRLRSCVELAGGGRGDAQGDIRARGRGRSIRHGWEVCVVKG